MPKTVVGFLNSWGAQKGPMLPPVVARKGEIGFTLPIAPMLQKKWSLGVFSGTQNSCGVFELVRCSEGPHTAPSGGPKGQN